MKRFILLSVFLTFLLSSCGGHLGSSHQNTTTTVVISGGYLGLFSDLHQNQLLPITVQIDVNGLNNNGSVGSDFKHYNFPVNNDDYSNSNLEFRDIQVPESGGFSITVTALSTSCYKFCDYHDPSCSGYNTGHPQFRQMKVNHPYENAQSSYAFYNMSNLGCF